MSILFGHQKYHLIVYQPDHLEARDILPVTIDGEGYGLYGLGQKLFRFLRFLRTL
jgi:hypothetical protein